MMIVTIVVGSISYAVTVNSVKESVEDYNTAMLQQTKTVIDEKVMSVNRLAIQLAFNPYILKTAYETSVDDNQNSYTISKIIDILKAGSSSNEFIDGLYVFYPMSDVVVNDEGKFTTEFFLNEIMPYENLAIVQWKNVFKSKDLKGFKPVEKINYKTYTTEILPFYQPLSTYTQNSSLGAVVVYIDKEKINELLEQINIYENSAVFVLNRKNEIIMSSGNNKLQDVIRTVDTNDKSQYYSDSEFDKVVVTSEKSESSGWRYVSVVPSSTYYSKASYVINVVVIITFIQLVLGVFLALIMTQRSYKPIRKTYDKLMELLGIKKSNEYDSVDHFSFIEQMTATTIRENAIIKESMEKARPVLKADLVNQLLRGTSYGNKVLEEDFKNLGIDFKGEKFVVIKIHIDDCSEFVESSTLQEMALVKLVIGNIMEEVAQKHFDTMFLDLDYENSVMLLNINENSDNGWQEEPNLYEMIMNVIKESQNYITDKFSIFISVGISSVHQGRNEINLCFREAEEALGFRLIRGNGSITSFSELKEDEGRYIYSIQTEINLINSVKTGDFEKVIEILDMVFQENSKSVSLSLNMTRCLFFDVVSTAIKIVDELHISRDPVFGEDLEPISQILKCETAEEMNIKLREFYKYICDYINSNKKSHNIDLRDRIINYIEEYYMDNSLSLISLSDSLKLNPTYVSYFFKEQVGENFINYISKLRIKKAKEIMANTNISIQEIAEKVGYANSGVFIRAFKKYEGNTPGRYRELV